MKILAHESVYADFSAINTGAAFYDNAGHLYMKIDPDKWSDSSKNAVSLDDGVLWTFEKTVRVALAHVHIEDD